jgi:hypothetical protein
LTTKDTRNANEKLIDRINVVLENLSTQESSYPVLDYIRKSLTPAAIERRDEWDKSVTHLHEVANEHLRIHEQEVHTA